MRAPAAKTIDLSYAGIYPTIGRLLMKLYRKQFLGLETEFTAYEKSAVAILPVPYEGGISYLPGVAGAPDAVLEASKQLELYDEVLQAEPYRMGISTISSPVVQDDAEAIIRSVHQTVVSLAEDGKFIALLGGDHSITSGCFQALHECHSGLSAIQLDAHADLRDLYEGSRYSHACAMSRIRDFSQNTLQLGIRSLSLEEAERVESEGIVLYTMDDYRKGLLDMDAAFDRLPDPVYVTVDVDVFDWSVMRSTGTPEPGGFMWDEGLHLIYRIFKRKNVVGFDVVELAYHHDDHNSPFAVAKLIYKMLGFKLLHFTSEREMPWPSNPIGSIFELF